MITAQQIAKIGDFTWEVETGEVTWSNGLYELLRYDKSERIDYARVNAEIHHPDDLERVTKWLNDCIESGKTELVANEYRLIRKENYPHKMPAKSITKKQIYEMLTTMQNSSVP